MRNQDLLLASPLQCSKHWFHNLPPLFSVAAIEILITYRPSQVICKLHLCVRCLVRKQQKDLVENCHVVTLDCEGDHRSKLC